MNFLEQYQIYHNILAQEFERNSWPAQQRLEELAQQTGWNSSQIRRWFERYRLHIMGPIFKEISPELEYILVKEFDTNSRPSLSDCQELSEITGLTIETIQKWFNQKAATKQPVAAEAWTARELQIVEEAFNLNPKFSAERYEQLAKHLNNRTMRAVMKKFYSFKRPKKPTKKQQQTMISPSVKQQLLTEMQNDSQMPKARALQLAAKYDLPSWRRLQKWWHHNTPDEVKPKKLSKKLQVFYNENPFPSTQQIEDIAEQLKVPVAEVRRFFVKYRKADFIE